MSETTGGGPGSVSRLLGGLRDGDGEAVRQLWLRYARPLVRLTANQGAADVQNITCTAASGAAVRPHPAQHSPDADQRPVIAVEGHCLFGFGTMNDAQDR